MTPTPIIIAEVGSTAHGIDVGTSDHDCMGIYIEDPEVLLGLDQELGNLRYSTTPEGRTEPGDIDVNLYPLRRYVRLAAEGNPNFLPLLYSPMLHMPDVFGIQQIRHDFLSKRLIPRHLSYSDKVVKELTGQTTPLQKRPELIERHGFDTKHAYNAVRLLLQCAELLNEQHMQMPMLKQYRDMLLAIRNGGWSQREVMELIDELQAVIEVAREATPLPDFPDYGKLNKWLIDVHQARWDWDGQHEGVLP